MKLNHLHSTASVKHGPLVMRKKLTAPALAAMILLTACGGGEVPTETSLGVMSSVDQVLQSEQISEQTSVSSSDESREKALGVVDDITSINLFNTFYENKYEPFAKKAAAKEMLVQYKKVRYGSMPIFSVADLENIGNFNFAWNNLTSTLKTNFETNLRTALKKTTTAYTLTELNTYINWGKNMPSSARNILKQHRQFQWHYLNTFLKTLAPSIYNTHITASNTAETNDDKRYLKGTTEDYIEEYTLDNKTMVRFVYGDKRKHVERTDIAPLDDWPSKILLHRYDDPKTVEYGVNSTTFEPAIGEQYTDFGIIVKESYVITNRQLDAIDDYIEKDIEKNGAMPNFSEYRTRNNLRDVARYLVSQTGDPYDAYAKATIIVRGAASALSAYTRALIASPQKYINIQELYETMANRANGLVTLGSLQTEKNVQFAVSGAIALTLTSFMLNTIGWRAAEDAFRNKTSLDDAKIETYSALKSFFNFARPASTFTAYGFLKIVGTDPTVAKDQARKWLPTAFGVSDWVSAANDIATAVYDDTLTIEQKRIRYSIAGVNILSGAYSVFGTLTPCMKWKWTRFENYMPPIKFATISSSISAVGILLSLAYSK